MSSGSSGSSGVAAGGRGSAPREASVGELMRREFITVSATESLLEARRIMRLARLRHLLVEQEGVLVGVLSYRDLQDRAVTHLESQAEAVESAPLEGISVEAAMAASPYVISPDTSLSDAAGRLSRLGVGCLPVVDGSDPEHPRLVGLITEADLLRAAYAPRQRSA